MVTRVIIGLMLGWLLGTSPVRAGVDQVYEAQQATLFSSNLSQLLKRGRTLAVLIGISQYEEFPQLASTSRDVERLRTFLLEHRLADTVYVVTEERVTRTRLDELMVDILPSRVKPYDRVLFYWSGHGIARTVSDGRTEGYLPLKMSRKNRYSTMVSMDDLRRWDDLLNVQQTLFILDSCLSGLAGIQSKSDAAKLSIAQLGRPSRHLLVAGTAEENALAGERWGGSLFTDAILKGLSGAADPGNGVVSLSDLVSFVRRYVAIEKDRVNWINSLTPQVRDLGASTGEFYFVVKAAGASGAAVAEQQSTSKVQSKSNAAPSALATAAPQRKITEQKSATRDERSMESDKDDERLREEIRRTITNFKAPSGYELLEPTTPNPKMPPPVR